jgi:hypothetical protein
LVVEWADARAATDAPALVANAVENGLPEVRLERPLVPVLELVEPLETLEDRVLYQVFRFREIAGPSWQPSRGPSLQRRDVAPKQDVQSLGVAIADAYE